MRHNEDHVRYDWDISFPRPCVLHFKEAMRKSIIGVLGILLVLAFACRPKEEDGALSGCERTKLSSRDSGVLTGIIAEWDKPGGIVAYGGLWVIDSGNDTIIFRVEPNLTENFDEAKLRKGGCVTVTYSREIVEEDGIELNRFYYAGRLEYQ